MAFGGRGGAGTRRGREGMRGEGGGRLGEGRERGEGDICKTNSRTIMYTKKEDFSNVLVTPVVINSFTATWAPRRHFRNVQ